jgi:hypothetical protein
MVDIILKFVERITRLFITKYLFRRDIIECEYAYYHSDMEGDIIKEGGQLSKLTRSLYISYKINN